MTDNTEVWEALAAPLRPDQIKFKRGKGSEEMPYIDGRDVMERFNAVVPGQWSYRWSLVNIAEDGTWVIKAAMEVLGVVHEDVGIGEAGAWGGPQKSAVSDGLKRCAVHYGFATELYQESTADLKRKANRKPTSKRQQRPSKAARGSETSAAPKQGTNTPSMVPTRPWSLDTIREVLNDDINSPTRPDAERTELMTPEARQTLYLQRLKPIYADDEERGLFMQAVLGKTSITQLTVAEGKALWKWAGDTAHAPREVNDVLASLDAETEAEEEPLFPDADA